MKAGPWKDLVDGLIGVFVRSSHEQVVTCRYEALGDRCDLIRSLTCAENDLRDALPDCAVMINAGEPQILERRAPHYTEELFFCGDTSERAAFDVSQDRAKLVAIHIRR